VRVVEIADFDWSPCGGTHATSTGEVGLIVVRASERAKRMVRIHLLAGRSRSCRLSDQQRDQRDTSPVASASGAKSSTPPSIASSQNRRACSAATESLARSPPRSKPPSSAPPGDPLARSAPGIVQGLRAARL
jgi:alanyl-tRNA synthetase